MHNHYEPQGRPCFPLFRLVHLRQNGEEFTQRDIRHISAVDEVQMMLLILQML